MICSKWIIEKNIMKKKGKTKTITRKITISRTSSTIEILSSLMFWIKNYFFLHLKNFFFYFNHGKILCCCSLRIILNLADVLFPPGHQIFVMNVRVEAVWGKRFQIVDTFVTQYLLPAPPQPRLGRHRSDDPCHFLQIFCLYHSKYFSLLQAGLERGNWMTEQIEFIFLLQPIWNNQV